MQRRSPDSSLLAELLDRGATRIEDLVRDETEETLYLEFKTLGDSSGKQLTREDRKVLAKAICGLANADGGTLIVGVGTSRIGNLDVASSVCPIGNVAAMRNRVAAATAEMLSPPHAEIVTYAVPSTTEDGRGYLVIDVPRSDLRPHYSNVHHQYFRRGSDGTRVLEHSEIRELMFLAREVDLQIDVVLRSLLSFGDLRFNLELALILRNASRVPAVAPYVRLSQVNWQPGTGVEALSTRFSSDRMKGIYASRDILVHPHDDIRMASFTTGLDFRLTGQTDAAEAISMVREAGDRFVRMMSLDQMPINPQPGDDAPVLAAGFYGAENAAVKEFQFVITKPRVLALFCHERGLAWE